MSGRLTIVMPLRGRNLFTLRYLFHADRMKMRHRFLVADGLVHPVLAGALERPEALFPNLDIEYVRYPDDQNFSFFFSKLADALCRVQTPYAMLADNDDFVLPSGLEMAMDFLDATPTHVACSGQVLGFSVYSGLSNASGGLMGRLNRLYQYYAVADASDADVMARLRRCGLLLWPFYSVVRTPALRMVCREVAEIGFSDLQLHETYHGMRLLTLGSARHDGSFATCIRQYGTSLNASFKKDWIHHLVRSRFTQDIENMIGRISSAAITQGADPTTVNEELYGMLEGKFRQIITATYGSLREVKQEVSRQIPGIVQAWKNRRRWSVAREQAALAQSLRRSGASADYMAMFGAEMTALRDVVEGDEFHSFIAPFLPVFAAVDAGHRKSSNVG